MAAAIRGPAATLDQKLERGTRRLAAAAVASTRRLAAAAVASRGRPSGANASTMRAVGAAVAFAALLAWTGLPSSDQEAPAGSDAGALAPRPAPELAPVTHAVTDRGRQGSGSAGSARARDERAADFVASAESGSDASAPLSPFAAQGPLPASSGGSTGTSSRVSGADAGPVGSLVGDADKVANDQGVPSDISGATDAATGGRVDDELGRIPERP